MEIDIVQNEKWYTIEELASLCGYELNTLKFGEKNLAVIMQEMSINIKVNTQMGGYHNRKCLESLKTISDKKFCSQCFTG